MTGIKRGQDGVLVPDKDGGRALVDKELLFADKLKLLENGNCARSERSHLVVVTPGCGGRDAGIRRHIQEIENAFRVLVQEPRGRYVVPKRGCRRKA